MKDMYARYVCMKDMYEKMRKTEKKHSAGKE